MWSLSIDLRQFQNDMRRLPSQIHAAADKVNQKHASEFEKVIRRNVSRSDLGPHIADTLHRYQGDAKTAEHIVQMGNDALPYGNALEFGHRLNGQWIDGAHVWQPAKKLIVRKHRKALARAILREIKKVLGL